MKRASIALALLVASHPVPARPAEVEREHTAGFLCPVDREHATAWTGPAAPRAVVGRARGEDGDLVTLRWSGVSARPVSQEIPIVVQEGTVGLVIRAEAERDRFLVQVELIGPDGTLLACHECPDAPVEGQTHPGRGTAQVPSTDRPGWQLVPGRYAFRVRAIPFLEEIPGVDGVDVDVVATLRSDASAEVRHLLDLNFVYLPGSGLSTEIAPVAPLFAGLLDHIDEWMAPTGVQIGRVTHNNLHRPEFSVIATWGESGEMFRTSAELGTARALNVYCVQSFERPLLNVVGLSGGIPGPIDDGNADSGIIIRSPQLFTCSNCLDAYGSLFAHEIGHYLGLYHTTEVNRERWDPLGDTPQCLAGDLRACPDYHHVMFPLIHAATIWSPAQIEIVRTHPKVYTVPVIRPVTRSAPLAARPNPFRDRIRVELGEGEGWRVAVHDVAGRTVRELGTARGVAVWDGRDARGRETRGGVYFVRASRGQETRTQRIVKLR